MSLNQLSDIKRILFLQEFTGDLVLHSTEDERLRHLIKVERIKRKLLKEPEKSLAPVSNIIFRNEFQKSKPIIEVREYKPSIVRKIPPKIIPISKYLNKDYQNHPNKTRITNELINELNRLINDKNVQMIECPGAEKNIIVKVRNKINLTKIIFNEEEINNIINYFSDSARIPIMGGILKASLGSITISAISSSSRSRFIINKINPYNLININNI
ncbi:MAG: hypothetical protein AABW83_01230 [Nanoarchaeota archaeon]